MALINLDFTNVESNRRLDPGVHTVSISNAELKKASTGADMLAITYRDDTGATAFDNFVILPQSMWKLKIFLEAVYNSPFTSKVSLDSKTLIGKKLIITTEDEEYINTNGQPAKRTRVIPEYKSITVTEMMGETPKPPFVETPKPEPEVVAPQPTPAPTPVQPTQPTRPARPKLPWEE